MKKESIAEIVAHAETEWLARGTLVREVQVTMFLRRAGN